MSKPLLIVILVAALAGIAGLVWWQNVSYRHHENELKKQLQQEQDLQQENRPFIPGQTSENRSAHPGWVTRLVGAYL